MILQRRLIEVELVNGVATIRCDFNTVLAIYPSPFLSSPSKNVLYLSRRSLFARQSTTVIGAFLPSSKANGCELAALLGRFSVWLLPVIVGVMAPMADLEVKLGLDLICACWTDVPIEARPSEWSCDMAVMVFLKSTGSRKGSIGTDPSIVCSIKYIATTKSTRSSAPAFRESARFLDQRRRLESCSKAGSLLLRKMHYHISPSVLMGSLDFKNISLARAPLPMFS